MICKAVWHNARPKPKTTAAQSSCLYEKTFVIAHTHTHIYIQCPSCLYVYLSKYGLLPTLKKKFCVCMCVSLVSRVPPSCLLTSCLLLPSESPWVLHRLPFWSLLSLFTCSSFPHSPQISLQQEEDVSALPPFLLLLHSLLHWFFGVPLDPESHLILSHFDSYLVPCLLFITLFFFLLRLSSDESPTFVQACRCGTVQPTHAHTIICHANTKAPAYYSSKLCLSTAWKSSLQVIATYFEGKFQKPHLQHW